MSVLSRAFPQVCLVGAGPGDPELLTLRAFRALQQAEVVLHDNLVSDAILDLCPVHCERVDVGKIPGARSTAQDVTNSLIVEHARRGKRVVRLKGGDPLVFGRGLEEALHVTAAGFGIEIVPGISSAVAGPTAALVPVTHRGVATSFSVITASGADETGSPLESQWSALARAGGTLVFLMGVARAERITSVLLEAGLPADRPCAVIESAYTAGQRTTRTSLGELAQDIRRNGVRNPAVIVVGDVVAIADQLHAQLALIEANTSSQPPTNYLTQAES
jgi:uroporphyrin-III C-methyltransferase